MKVVNYYFNALMENVSALGSIFTHLLLLAVAFILNDAVFSPLLKGLILIYVIIMPIKIILFRNRPKKMKYKQLWEKFEASSFPSVHSARAIFLALVLSFRFSNAALSVLAALVSAMVVYSRIHMKKHYWGDVIGGAMGGAVIYFLATV
ncbi:MAG: phosphatase PAP2 family protein [Candidatus Aenigmarchaeota archaeon]|nr:phosphatase PAP2 family protein [Candidatus Aenigmarchaeota archaeon]